LLAPGVRLEASLIDISRADAAAAIVTSHRYAVRVVLMKDARLIFTTDQVCPVLTGGNPASV